MFDGGEESGDGRGAERAVCYDMNSASGRQRMEKLAWWSAG